MSVLPPAANGTMIVTDRVGQSAARSGAANAAKTRKAAAATSAANGSVCLEGRLMSGPEFDLAPAPAQGSIDSTARLRTVRAAIVAEAYASRAPGQSHVRPRPLPSRQETCKLGAKIGAKT